MTWAVVGGLVGLALVDSTSFGTLGVPLWMLVHPRPRPVRVLLYLGVLSLFYLGLGLLLLGGADLALSSWSALEDSRALDWAQLVIGVLMLIGSFWPDTPWAKRRAAEHLAAAQTAPDPTGRPLGRRGRWRERVTGPEASIPAVAGVALAAGVVEAASMLPYLGAIALISTQPLGSPGKVGVLAGYVLVMALPALVLLALRIVAARRVEPLLARLDRWLTRATSGAIWWVLGLLGFFLAADGARRLGLLGG